MTLIADRIANIWPLTDALLSANVAAYPGALAQAISDSIVTLWSQVAPTLSVPQSVENYPLPIQQQIADMAVLLLIPIARDYYMQTKLTQSSNVQHAGGSISESTYNKIQALDGLRTELRAQIMARQTQIEAILFPPSQPTDAAEGADVPGLCPVAIEDMHGHSRDSYPSYVVPEVDAYGNVTYATGFVGDLPGPVTRVQRDRRRWPY